MGFSSLWFPQASSFEGDTHDRSLLRFQVFRNGGYQIVRISLDHTWLINYTINNDNFIFHKFHGIKQEISSSNVCNEFSVQEGVLPVVHPRYGPEAPEQHNQEHQDKEELYDVSGLCIRCLCVTLLFGLVGFFFALFLEESGVMRGEELFQLLQLLLVTLDNMNSVG